MAEDPLAELFERVIEELHPEIESIVEAAESRGRRLRTRRRVRIAVGNTLAVAVVAVGGTAFALHRQAPQPPQTPASVGGSAEHSMSVKPSPITNGQAPQPSPSVGPGSATATAGPSLGASPQYIFTATPSALPPELQIYDDLKPLLPAGSQVSDMSAGAPPGWFDADYNDGRGVVDFMLQNSAPGPDSVTLTCPAQSGPGGGTQPSGWLPPSCAVRTLPDGSIERDAVTQVDSGTMQEWEAVVENPVWQTGTGSSAGL